MATHKSSEDDQALSRELIDYIDSRHSELLHEAGEEQMQFEEDFRFLRNLVELIVKSRESLIGGTSGTLTKVERLVRTAPEMVRELLDERFTRDVLEAVPGIVSRVMELSHLDASRTPSRVTNRYLGEAVRTYIFGFPQASMALSRAALEQALKEELGSQGIGVFVSMNGLLDEAQGAGIIDATIRRAAREIANAADDVLHERPASLNESFNVLIKLRGVLHHVYAE